VISQEHKYIRHSTAGFIVWPVATGQIWHKHVLRTLQAFAEEGEVLSAGMCEFDSDGTVKCYGHSESTGLKSRPDDSEALAKQMGLVFRSTKK